jgi:hypothetical protein
MKILFITTIDKKSQGDYLELTVINGMRKLLGENFIEFPKKKIMYHDFSESSKSELHGKGFTMLRNPIHDVDRTKVLEQKYDAIIYGSGHIIGEEICIDDYDKLANGNVWVLDGHDLFGEARVKKEFEGKEIIGNQFKKSFKRELVFKEESVFPTGYGIPEEIIMPINLSKKKKLFQSTYPKHANFEKATDLAGSREHHVFDKEVDYYEDMASSWFGLTSIKGGWDSLRHYEILASGSLLLFRDYENKPEFCSPQKLPCFSYSNKTELDYLLNNLIEDNTPSKEYINMLNEQRKWLIENGTTVARAKNILQVIENFSN